MNQPHSFYLILCFLWIQIQSPFQHCKLYYFKNHTTGYTKAIPAPPKRREWPWPVQLLQPQSLLWAAPVLAAQGEGEECALHQRDQFFWGVEGSEQCDIIRPSCVH